ncbi:alpha/beta hydrolase [Stackebrandtia soli]|uniref:alpha/beta hydrolase n=1 Tax=Stackebrandtia soli TaxID=1892856 RepID=UPI0039EB36CE
MLCHGFTGNPSSMRPWGDHLHAAGYNVFCPRLPGHGTRWQDMSRTRWQDWYGELDRAFDEALATGVPVFAAGLSMGGTLTLRLAEERGDELAGLVLVNPSVFSKKFAVNYLVPFIHRFVATVPGIGSDIAKPDAVETSYNKVPLPALNSLRRLWKLVRSDLARVDVPVRVYRSAVDHVVEPENTALVLASISSKDVVETILPRSFHVATLDHDADVIFDNTVAFIKERLTSLQASQ